MTSHPIVTLRFEAILPLEFETFERHWYHVPRVGDIVEIDIGTMVVHGTVKVVFWGEDHVTVRLR
jgi:hypothetical protein